jgi:hypothetical protein
LIQHPSIPRCGLLHSTRVVRYPRKEPVRVAATRLSKESSSPGTTVISQLTSEGNPEEATPTLAPGAPPNPAEPPSEDVEKPKRRRASSTKELETSCSLPEGLDILWLPQDTSKEPSPGSAQANGGTPPSDPALPPLEIFNEVLTNLYITLHPQTQHRATFASGGTLTEPTLALYCPIEGGDYVIDATVRELGRQTGAEVVVLDGVHLAAGECGHFNKGECLVILFFVVELTVNLRQLLPLCNCPLTHYISLRHRPPGHLNSNQMMKQMTMTSFRRHLHLLYMWSLLLHDRRVLC